MDKKLEKSLVEYGLAITDKNTAYGVKNGYEITATSNTMDMNAPVVIHIACYATAMQRSAIESALANRTDIKGVKKMTEFGLSLGINGFTIGSIAKRLPSILDWTLGMLNINGALGVDHCAHCGKPLDGNGQKCNVGGATVTLDDECVATANALIDTQNQQFNARPNNILKGTIGALIGGIVGGLTVVLFYLIGFVSALSGIVAVALGAFLYTKLGGKPNKIMILIVTVVSIVCLVASVFITYIVASGIAVRSELGLSVSGFDAFAMLMEVEEFRSAFYLDLAMVIIFAVVGMGIYIYGLWRKIKTNGKQQHISATPNSVEQHNTNTNVDPFTETPKDTVAGSSATDNNDTSENK